MGVWRPHAKCAWKGSQKPAALPTTWLPVLVPKETPWAPGLEPGSRWRRRLGRRESSRPRGWRLGREFFEPPSQRRNSPSTWCLSKWNGEEPKNPPCSCSGCRMGTKMHVGHTLNGNPRLSEEMCKPRKKDRFNLWPTSLYYLCPFQISSTP